jgi:hypothetical protein
VKATEVEEATMRAMLIATLALFALSLPALADCLGPDGNSYPTGTRLGALVCQDDGSWQP